MSTQQERPRDLYEVLGIARSSTPSQVTLAFFDRVGNVGGTGTAPDPERARELYRAYEVLSNPTRRREYDAQLLAAPQDAPPPHAAASGPVGPAGHVGPTPPQPAFTPPHLSQVPSAAHGVTGSSYPIRPINGHPRSKRSRVALSRPHGAPLVTLVLLFMYGALFVTGVMSVYANYGDEVLGLAGPILVVWALMAWAGIAQVRSRRRETGYIIVVLLQVLLVVTSVGSMGLDGALFFLVGLVLYAGTVEMWRRQLQRIAS